MIGAIIIIALIGLVLAVLFRDFLRWARRISEEPPQ